MHIFYKKLLETEIYNCGTQVKNVIQTQQVYL